MQIAEKDTAKRLMREAKEQAALIKWAALMAVSGKYHGIGYMFAIPNGAYLQGDARRRAMQWSKLRQQGVRSGVSDLFLPVPTDHYAGLWIEMKAPKPFDAAVSDEQADWIAAMQEHGYAAYVAYGWTHAVEIIDLYYGYKK